MKLLRWLRWVPVVGIFTGAYLAAWEYDDDYLNSDLLFLFAWMVMYHTIALIGLAFVITR